MQKTIFHTLLVIFLMNLLQSSMAQSGGSANQTDSFIQNGVIAHRGAWKKDNLPQNSIASLKNAIRIGAAGSEFDVQLTADDILVINHDPDYAGMPVEKTNYTDLAKVPLSNGELIPTLESYLKTGMSQQKTRLILELKPSILSKERSLLLAQKVVKMVERMHAQKWIIFISFDYDILKKIHQLIPAAKTMYLAGNISPEQLKSDGIWGADYHYKAYQKDDKWISKAHGAGIQTNVWTVDNSLLMDYFLARNIDFITTNEPELLISKVSGNIHDSKWQLVWDDEFNYNGLPDSTKWSYNVGGNGWGNNELEYYTKADTLNAKVQNGLLTVTVRKNGNDKNPYTSARLVSKNKGDWKYGKMEIRAKLPKGRGLWPAIWMLPSENKYGTWPACGEIDIMENVGYNPDTVFVTVHTKSFNHLIGTQVTKGIRIENLYDDFHTYGIEWDTDQISFFIDGQPVQQFKNSGKGFAEWPFDQFFHLIMNVAVGGGWGGKHGVDTHIFPASMEVDYVRVFKTKLQ